MRSMLDAIASSPASYRGVAIVAHGTNDAKSLGLAFPGELGQAHDQGDDLLGPCSGSAAARCQSLMPKSRPSGLSRTEPQEPFAPFCVIRHGEIV
jgi:hypothetical protein